jgi:chromosome segregation protein
MRLRSLEIKGFKSFAEETIINFNEDVIGIVGPNGSGKSNVVDAIRWVLGEQKSKELRLDKMSSVIFNGTKKRKEGNTAQVTLTFENTKNILPTEYNMVSMTRILYRSGESEYRLNGVTCRLKDITSLLMDTGIGSNSYAIIALGMVDDILENKENARRRMFEQAAGVSKYKARKHETMQKLDATTADLERVQDLVFEIEKNLESLEKQAKRTQKYFDMRERYKELSIALAIIKVNAFKADYKNMEQQITKEEDNYRGLEAEIRNSEAALEKEKAAHIDKEKDLSDRQRELNSLVGKIRGRENDKRMAEQKTQFVVQNKTTLANDIATLKGKIVQLEEDIDYYRTELNVEKKKETKLEEALETTNDKLKNIRENHTSMKGDMDTKLNFQQGIEREINEFDKRKAININQIENLENDIKRRKQDVATRVQELDFTTGNLKEIEEKESAIALEISGLEEKEIEKKANIETTEKKIEELNKKSTEINRRLDSKKNEYKLTKSMVESMEGFPESIKYLQANKEFKSPLLSDLIYVKENYRAAIENYLESYLNYYVSDTYDDAIKAIRLLSTNQKGKANFFVLEAFKDYKSNKNTFAEATNATDFVEVDAKYKALTSYLLENVFISNNENLDLSNADIQDNITLLSQSGAYSKRRFSIAGGSVGLFEGKKIGRKKNLEILENEIKTAEAESKLIFEELTASRTALNTFKSVNFTQKIQALYNDLNKNAQIKLSIKLKIEGVENYAKENEERNKTNQSNVDNLKKENENLDNQLTTKRNELNILKSDVSNSGDAYRMMADQFSAASAEYNEANINFIRQQNKVSSFQRELSFRENAITENRSNLQRNEVQLKNSDAELLENQQFIDEITKELQEGYRSRKDFEKTLNDAEGSYYKARTVINELDDKVRKLGRSQADVQSLVNRLKDKFNDIKLQLTSIGERLQVEFKLGINDIINQEPDPQYKRAELDEEVSKLKNRLDNYGEINPMAVEAYNEMNERYQTITVQRDDILTAKESLMETIREIEETATKQFLESFQQIRSNFIEIFRTLFTEDDKADLSLENPANPLESPINIIAQPKGKRPQSIAQLSGGEKTLTATALLFALYLLKPAPFCIFDEVDAPLDDANIEKFNRIIKKFSKDSQFIIVTHNKATMSAVDVIYGVYMPEQGVSAVTPVDFRSLDDKRGYVNAMG